MYEDKIKSLDVSQGWKDKFIQIDKARPIKFGIVSKFKNRKELSYGSQINFFALLFGVFYYAVLGMWKKALSLLALIMLPTIAFGIVNSDAVIIDFVSIFVAIFAARMANGDYYRLKVLDEENFWW